MAGKKKQLPPKTREEGTQRILKLTDYLYSFEGKPEVMALSMIDATYQMIDRVGDPEAHHTALQEALQAAYDRLKD